MVLKRCTGPSSCVQRRVGQLHYKDNRRGEADVAGYESPRLDRENELSRARFQASVSRIYQAACRSACSPRTIATEKLVTCSDSHRNDPPGQVFERTVLYYADWLASHERAHVKHIQRIVKTI